MPTELQEMQQRFGDRFSGMELSAVEQIFWPVFRHRLVFSIRQFVPLDVLEEGLLRVVLAGVTDLTEVTDFLGCSVRYGKKMTDDLANRAGGLLQPALKTDNTAVFSTNTTEAALTSCERAVIVTREVVLLRDAVFGQWIDFGEHRFRCVPLGPQLESPARWLGPQVPSSAASDVQDTVRHVIGLQPAGEEILAKHFDDGELQWVRLYLGCYQPQSRKSGRFLLFNPEHDDQPLPGLSGDFERMLGCGGTVTAYFQDDSTRAFWTAMAGRLKAAQAQDEIATRRVHVDDLHKALVAAENARANRPRTFSELQKEFSRQLAASGDKLASGSLDDALSAYRSAVEALVGGCFSKAKLEENQNDIASKAKQLRSQGQIAADQLELLLSHIRTAQSWTELLSGGELLARAQITAHLPASVAGLRLLACELGVTETAAEAAQAPLSEERAVERAIAEISRQRSEIENLEKLVAEMPTTRHLRVDEHPAILHQALRAAREVLVLISPWIKMRVLSRYLPDIDSALERGCELWIGYGMPRSDFHRDNSDDRALTALAERAQRHRLFLVELGTHEKVLIQDDDVFVNTSFNWLSYDGGDGRRESGLLQQGGVQAIKEKFLIDLKARQMSLVERPAKRQAAPVSRGVPS
jgi:hypothetical protein